MGFNQNVHGRRSIRLKGYDYSSAGGYFITIVTQGRECLFGAIRNGEMELNDAGKMVAKWWDELPHKFPSVTADASILMPNHFHSIIIIHDDTVGADLRVCPDSGAHPGAPLHAHPDLGEHAGEHTGGGAGEHTGGGAGEHIGSPPPIQTDFGEYGGSPVRGMPRPNAPLSQIVQWFKTMTTNEYIRGVKQSGWPPFAGKLWQRNYYEHIIRDQPDYERIANYIASNPSKWETDMENPQAIRS